MENVFWLLAFKKNVSKALHYATSCLSNLIPLEADFDYKSWFTRWIFFFTLYIAIFSWCIVAFNMCSSRLNNLFLVNFHKNIVEHGMYIG